MQAINKSKCTCNIYLLLKSRFYPTCIIIIQVQVHVLLNHDRPLKNLVKTSKTSLETMTIIQLFELKDETDMILSFIIRAERLEER